ncbi:MAG: sigma-70 family RNA polymerase sigma factor [Gemmatimonadetes bacterium]|nr:sigma-70 family RNA polymerase sigma factor [Gemmatimonadota bacterium]
MVELAAVAAGSHFRGVANLTEGRGAAGPAGDAVDVALAAAGDTGAFERLYRRHVARIHSLARRMLGPGEADDATQEVFVRAWQKLGTFRGEAAFGTWLYRLAIRALLARRAALLLSRRRYLEGDVALEHTAARAAPTELRLDFAAAVERLPAGARQVLVLHDVEGYRHDEIGSMLGISAGTSKSQLHRARMMLRGYLDA